MEVALVKEVVDSLLDSEAVDQVEVTLEAVVTGAAVVLEMVEEAVVDLAVV